MLDIQKVKLLISVCLICVAYEWLTDLSDDSIICLLEECLVMATYFQDIKTVMKVCGMLGSVYFKSGEYKKAIECYEKTLTIAKTIDDKIMKENINSLLGNAYSSLGNHLKTIEHHEKSLSIAKENGNRMGEGWNYRILGTTYELQGEYQKAIEYHEKSLIIEKEIGNRAGEGSCYGRLGVVYVSLGQYQTAIDYSEKSLSIAKEIGNKTIEGSSYGNLGNAYNSLGEYQKGIDYIEKGLNIAKEICNRAGEASCYAGLGSAYGSLREYHKAIHYHEKSLSIAKEIGNRAIEGSSYRRLGNTYESLGEYDKVIDCYEKCLSIEKEIGNRAGQGSCYRNLGEAYRLLGEYHKAFEYLEKGLNIAKEIGNREGEGSSYGSLGNTYQSSGQHHKAIDYLEKSLNIAKEIGDRAGEMTSYCNLGNPYVSLGQYQKAIDYNEKSLSIAKEIGDRAIEGSSYGNLGNAYQSLGEYQKAINYHKKSVNIAKEIGNRAGEGGNQGSIGVCYMQESSIKNLDKADEHLQNSIDCYEKMFDDLREKDQLKISFVDTYVKAYKCLIVVQLENKRIGKALLVSERGRARALRDLLSLKYNTTERCPSKQKALELDDVKTVSSSGDTSIIFYDLHRNKLTTRFWVICARSNSIFFYNEIKEREAFEKIISNLSQEEETRIEHLYLKHLVENSFLQMSVREQIKCEDRSLESLQSEDLDSASCKIPSKTIGLSSKDCREFLRCVYMEEDDDKPLQMLFYRLITPVLDKLTTEEIVIIPDGPLFMVPFAALQDPDTGNFLSETKRLRLAPSLTTLKILQETSTDRHYKSGALIIGDPAVGEVMYRGIKRDIYPLSGAREEAIEIGKLLGVESLIGEKATKEAVLSKLQHGVSVIHFAAHGSARNGEIFLAPSKPSPSSTATPEEKDYILTMKEAQESGVRAKLVVLSCCHSGRGEIKAEGVVGMTRAFLAAGARAVVASLWAIDDQATMFFMVKFYSHLKKGESASRSLQQAMKDMRETEEYKEPMYWAAFFLIGDDVTITV